MSNTMEDLITLSPRAPSPSRTSSSSNNDHTPAILNASTETSADTPPTSPPRDTATPFLDHSEPATQTTSQDTLVVQSQYASGVIISPLPDSTTKRDVLCRVRGGKVLSCLLSKLGDTLLAVVTFQDPASARHYVDFCAESFNKDLWTFHASPESVSSSHVEMMTSHVSIYTDAPGLGAIWLREDIPGTLKAYPSTTTRCLYLEDCSVERVAGIWARLGLAGSEHLRDQLEDMWLDGPRWNEATGETSGKLHVWYSGIKAALEAQRRCPGLQFETDPCSIMPAEAFILGPGNCTPHYKHSPEGVYIDHHSYPFPSLLDLHRTSVLHGVAQGILDPYEVFLGIRATQPPEENLDPKDLTDRLMHVLRMHADAAPPRPGPRAFKMPRPRPGYTHQFPPPMSGEPRAVRYPPEVAEAVARQQARAPGYLARRIAGQEGRRRLSCTTNTNTNTVASQNPADEDNSNSYQGGRPAGSGDSF